MRDDATHQNSLDDGDDLLPPGGLMSIEPTAEDYAATERFRPVFERMLARQGVVNQLAAHAARAVYPQRAPDTFPGLHALLDTVLADSPVGTRALAEALELHPNALGPLRTEGTEPATLFRADVMARLGHALGLRRDMFLDLVKKDHEAWVASGAADGVEDVPTLDDALQALRSAWGDDVP